MKILCINAKAKSHLHNMNLHELKENRIYTTDGAISSTDVNGKYGEGYILNELNNGILYACERFVLCSDVLEPELCEQLLNQN